MCGCGSKKPKPPVKPTGRIFLTIFSFFPHFSIVLTLRDKNTFFSNILSSSILASFQIFVIKSQAFQIIIYL